MDRVRRWWGRAANFVAGVELQQQEGNEDDGRTVTAREDEDKGCIYLVTYGSYGPLYSFDPDCLTAMVFSARFPSPSSPLT